MEETPLEVQSAMDIALKSIAETLRRLKATPSLTASLLRPQVGPTPRQGQFLAFIREYMMPNEAGVAPSHADLQRFFNLTPPSVNSILIRLEQRGFIRRIPRKARAIEITLPPDSVPPLDRPFKF
jgi:DNA-binding MarR family transcriptional regulator